MVWLGVRLDTFIVATTLTHMRLLAPAKINLHLCVGARSNDGFHPLVSWMCTVRLFDTLVFVDASVSAGQAELALSCDDATLPCDATNLVMRAAVAMRSTPAQGARIELHKQIPTGGGLGGGSSDAASTLRGLNRLWKLNHSSGQLAKIAATLGSDVPFFLGGASSICTGRGEIVRPIDPPKAGWCVLILPGLHVPTPDVYRRFDEMKLGEANVDATQPDWQSWSQLSADELLSKLMNDLEPPAFSLEPNLARLRVDAELLLGRPVRMSGSGSSLFTLYDAESAAEAAAETVAQKLSVPAVPVELAPKIDDDV